MGPYLIVGAGAIARRVYPLLPNAGRVFALCRDTQSMGYWREQGTVPILGDLDNPRSLERLGGLASTVLHFAPPTPSGPTDTRTQRLLCALQGSKILPQRLVYISTTGVYGNCHGTWTDETGAARPETARALRRANAEMQLRRFGRNTGCRISILRVPGIYDAGRLPLDRLRRGDPLPDSNPWTNHIHATDLARAILAALHHGKPQRVYNTVDDEPLTVLQFYTLLAQHFGLPVPTTLPFDQLKQHLSPMSLSFLSESRRLHNHRIKQELNLQWYYPNVRSFLERC